MGKKIAYKARPVSEKMRNHLNKVRRHLGPGVAASNALFNQYKWVAKKRDYDWNLTKEEFLSLTKQNCVYCDSPPKNEKNTEDNSGIYTYNGVDRVDNEKGYDLANTVPCCKVCNIAKGSQSLEEFKAWIATVNKRING